MVGAVALALAGAAALPLTRGWRDRRWQGLSLAQLGEHQKTHLSDPTYLYFLGRRLNEQGRFTEAAPFLERAAGFDPDDPRIREVWTQALLGSGQLSTAFGQLKQFAGTHPKLPEAHYLLGSYHLTQKAWQLAQQELEQAVALRPSYGQALSLLANACLQQNAIDQGRTYLERSLRSRPYAALDHLQLAILETSRDPVRAEREFAEAARLLPTHAETWRAWANFALGRGETKRAVERAQKAVGLAPEVAQNHYVLGRSLLQSGALTTARPALERAATLAPLNPLPAQELRLIARRTGKPTDEARWQQETERRQRYQSARRQVETKLKVTPQDSALRRELAALIAQTGEAEATVQEWARALRQRPDQPAVLAAAASSLVQGGFPSAAIPLARQAIQGAPNNVAAYEALADAYLARDWIHEAAVAYQSAANGAPRQKPRYQQRLAEAARKRQLSPKPAWKHYVAAQSASDEATMRAELERALAADPEHIESLRLLLDLAFRGGQPERALEYAQRLLALLPDDSQANTFAALVLLREPLTEARTPQIAGLLDRAEASGGNSGSLLYARGLFLQAQNRPKEALTYLMKSAQLDPGSRAVFKQIQTIAQQLGDRSLASAAQRQLDSLTQPNSLSQKETKKP